MRHAGSLVVVCGIQFPDRGLKPASALGARSLGHGSTRDFPAWTFLRHLSARVGGTVRAGADSLWELAPRSPGELLCLPRQRHVVSLGVQGLCHLLSHESIT